MTKTRRPRRALFIVHEAEAPPGYIGEAAHAHGFAVERLDIWNTQLLGPKAPARRSRDPKLPDPGAYDLIVPLGSAEAAYDDDVPWLAGELDLLRQATRDDVPVFGICFGAQVLARALGGTVRPAERPEIGWVTIDSDAEEVVSPGPWLEWHFDTLTPPAGAEVLARSASGIQAYQYGRHLGVQFHPEVSPQILEAWIAGSTQRLDAIGVDAIAFARETQRRAPRARAAAHELFDRLLARLGLI
jgi:GMP synthase (glutamine-hydrolysing)